ncbi:MAG: glutathione-independent formaldehyde dehydrogenase [Chloroflexi bacterium]|nr:glutathione-independent formaldehyde dehydrogenase [Chloroflexota bacterium]
MKAVVYKGSCQVAVEEVEDARIEAPTDAVVRITSTAICGSDLHMYEGRTAAKPGMVMGHENMGVIEDVGPAVQSVRRGDRVVMPFNIGCGVCFNCTRGWVPGCTTMNPESPGAGYGYVGMGPYRGGQAELLRVPFADFNCLLLPGEPDDALEDDYLLLSDIFPTGYHAAELAQVEPGDSVAVFGAGPVGLLATHSALLRGASQVFVVDSVAGRLDKAERFGGIPINFQQGDPVEQIMQYRKQDPRIRDSWRPGEDKLAGVMCGLDAVGYQARDRSQPGQERPTQVLEDLIRVTNATGRLGVVGVYLPQDPGASDPHAQQGIFEMPLGQIFNKGLTIGFGQCPVKRYNAYLRDEISAGRAQPGQIVSHHLPLDDAAEAYRHFDQRDGEFTKIVLKPSDHAA